MAGVILLASNAAVNGRFCACPREIYIGAVDNLYPHNTFLYLCLPDGLLHLLRINFVPSSVQVRIKFGSIETKKPRSKHDSDTSRPHSIKTCKEDANGKAMQLVEFPAVSRLFCGAKVGKRNETGRKIKE